MVEGREHVRKRLSEYLLWEDGRVSFNPKILTWARGRSRLAVDRVAWWVDEPPETIKSWEAGESTPTMDSLEVLAYMVFKLPFVTFFLREVPDYPDARSLKAFLAGLERCAPPVISLERAFTFYLMGLYLPILSAAKEPPKLRNFEEFSDMWEQTFKRWENELKEGAA